jgi:DNA-binding transcriptional ArsR family regulator
MSATQAATRPSHLEDSVWRALANPLRRELLDQLRAEPRTTGDLAEAIPGVSRFAVMQHLGVLVASGLVVVRRRGRHRFNHLNPVPLRQWYERWVVPLADRGAAEVLALKRHVESQEGVVPVPVATDQLRTVRIEAEMRFRATPERIFRALTEESLTWFPHTYGEDRVQRVVLEPRVGGLHYEDWGEGMGHVYGSVTEYDPPVHYATRGRVMPGSIIDSFYDLERDGDETILRVSKVAIGPMTDAEAEGVQRFGNTSRFEAALRALVEAA